MMIHLTRAKLPGLAATLVAGTLMFAATGSSHAVPQIGGVSVKPLEPIVHTVARRDHRSGGNKTTSSAPGGVTVTSQPRKRSCNAFDAFPRSCVGSPIRNRDHRTLRDHRTISRDHRCKGIECFKK